MRNNIDIPFVSVILCIYNAEKYLNETIDSILSQSYTDFELIIWNDGSTDNTENIIKGYNDPRICYFYHENTGLGTALHLACEKAKGKYIARIDGDDICLPSRLRKQVDYMEHNSDCVLLSSSCFYINDKGEVLGRSLNCTWNSVIKKTLKTGSATIHPAAMFRTDAYKKTCGYLGLKSSQDRVLWSKMAKYGTFHNLPDALIKYRLLSTSLSHILENNPYSYILEQLRYKMINDDVVLEKDIQFYNDIYKESKGFMITSNTIGYIPKVEERIYQKLAPLMGDNLTSRLLILFKNIYCYVTK